MSRNKRSADKGGISEGRYHTMRRSTASYTKAVTALEVPSAACRPVYTDCIIIVRQKKLTQYG